MSNRVIGILPAAGLGTRLGLPFAKELLPIKSHWDALNYKQVAVTVLETSLEQLSAAGVEEAVVVIRPEKQMICEYLKNRRRGVNIRYVEQKTMYSREGLPDAIMAAYDIAKDYDLCVMLMPDVYFTDEMVVVDLLAALTERSDAIGAVSTWLTVEPWRFGVVNSINWEVTSVVDKPDANKPMYHWGAVAFRPAFWPYILEEQQTLSNALNRAAVKGLLAVPARGEYLDLGLPQSYLDAVARVNS